MHLRSSKTPAVVAGVYPLGKWTQYEQGLYGYACKGDGNCFWRTSAVQMYGDQEQYVRVRRSVVAYVKSHPDTMLEGLPLKDALQASGFDSVDAWMDATLTDAYFGGFVEAALLALCFNYRVEVFTGKTPKPPATLVFNPDAKLALRFHYHNSHYDALFFVI